MQSYIQIGDKHLGLNIATKDPAPLDIALRDTFAEGKWTIEKWNGATLSLTRVAEAGGTGVRGARQVTNSINFNRMNWARPEDILPGQKLAVIYAQNSGQGVVLTLERRLACAKPAKPAPSSLADLRAKLRAAIDVVNEVKRELGDDAQIRIKDDGQLGVTLMMEV